MPVYNGEAHITQTLESLLDQDLQDFELIIADNASTDGTADICRRFASRDSRIRYFRNGRNLGAAGNYNRVFRAARAALFKWAPHDDLYAPTYLRKCVTTLEAAGPRTVLCYPRTRLVDETGTVIGDHDDDMDIREATPSQRLNRMLRHGTSWCHPVVGVIRSDVLRQTRLIGSYTGSDHVLLVELALRGAFHEYPEPLFLRRVREGVSPSLQANATPEDRDTWFDTRNRERIAVPRTRLLLEHVRAIRRARLTRGEALACYALLRDSAFAAYWARPALLNEWRRAARIATWDRHVLGGVRRARNHYLPHRAWALVSGLKKLNIRRLALAFSPPSRATHDALLEFVAECLSARADRRSREILEEWRESGGDARRRAVARVTNRQWPRFVGPA